MTNPPTAADADGAQARVIEMLKLLKARAPNIRPAVTPKPFKHIASSSLMALCSTQQQTAVVREFLAGKVREDREVHGEKADQAFVVIDTDVNFSKREFRIMGAKLQGKIDAALHDLQRLMDLQLNSSREQLEPYVRRFASANELGDDVSAGPVLQEVCSLAYALQVAASHMPGWTGYVGSQQLPLPADANMPKLLQELFEASPPPPTLTSEQKKTTGKPGSAGKGKKGSSTSANKDAKKKSPKVVENSVVASTPGGGAKEAVSKSKAKTGNSGTADGATRGSSPAKGSSSKRKKR